MSCFSQSSRWSSMLRSRSGFSRTRMVSPCRSRLPLLSYDAFHASDFTCIDFDGKDGLNHSLHIYIFHKFAVLDFGYLYVVLLDT